MKIFFSKILISFLVVVQSYSLEIDIYTEHYPPYNMKKDGKLTGLSVEILEAMIPYLDTKQTINDVKLTNWSRAYSIALKKSNSMVFSTTRTASRESLFQWVGPITSTRVGLIALKERNVKINSVNDLKKYQIGAVLKDVGAQLLIENGIDSKSIQYVKGTDAINLSFKKLANHRIDLFSYDINVAFANAKNEGFDTSKYEIVYVLNESELYYAFNKDTDKEVVKLWQKSLDTIKSNGTYQKILDNYKNE